VALEVLNDAPELDAILVPVGGGGLISGIAVSFNGLAPGKEVIAVQPEASPALRDSLRDGICYEEYLAGPTLCDGLAGGIGRTVFEVASQGAIHEIVVVGEDSIRQAVAAFARHEQLMVEGSGAVGLAAVMENPDRFRGRRVGLVVSGANIDSDRLAEVLTQA
jgi:threonine dehydratase